MGGTAAELSLVRDLWGNAFRISRWWIPGHDGIDLPAKPGTQIRAVADGTVSYARDARLDAHAGRAWAIGGGNVVNIDISPRFTTQYAHMQTIYVRAGQKVKKGQVIGTVGSTGGTPNSPNASFGVENSHLHFGLWDHETNKMIEPTRWLQAQRAGWTDRGGETGSRGQGLGGFGNLITLPEGHILTNDDIDNMMDAMRDAGWFSKTDPVSGYLGEDAVHRVLQTFIGQPWDKGTQTAMQNSLNTASQTYDQNAILATVLGPFATIAANLTDPGLWVRILALLVGLAAAGYGIVGILRSTASPSPAY